MPPKNYTDLFSTIPQTKTPEGLLTKTMETINAHQQKQQRFRLLLSSLTGAASFIGIIISTKLTLDNIYQYGMAEMISLPLQDTEAALLYWQSLGLAILETLPTNLVMAGLFSLWVFFQSLHMMAENWKPTHSPEFKTSHN